MQLLRGSKSGWAMNPTRNSTEHKLNFLPMRIAIRIAVPVRFATLGKVPFFRHIVRTRACVRTVTFATFYNFQDFTSNRC